VQFDESQVSRVKSELERRRNVLVGIARNPKSPIDKLDRHEIIVYLDKFKIPSRPKVVPDLLRTFFSSAFTYHRVRSFNKSRFGEIPTRSTIGDCLAVVFGVSSFRLDETWIPVKLRGIARQIQSRKGYDLNSREPEPRMIRVLLDGSLVFEKYLKDGITKFWNRWDEISQKGAKTICQEVEEFSRPIHNVGYALTCDFLKESGYSQFVKVDHHFRREFPRAN
jgi:hypothetical protein